MLISPSSSSDWVSASVLCSPLKVIQSHKYTVWYKKCKVRVLPTCPNSDGVSICSVTLKVVFYLLYLMQFWTHTVGGVTYYIGEPLVYMYSTKKLTQSVTNWPFSSKEIYKCMTPTGKKSCRVCLCSNLIGFHCNKVPVPSISEGKVKKKKDFIK